MKILIGAVFGIGNSIMRIPMIKAIHTLPGHSVDILVGSLPDDFGAYHILSKVVRPPAKVYIDSALECDYDLAIMSMPFDGRWRNGVHFRAKEVWDGRTRPDPSTTGLVSWERHEIDYQMDHARALGFKDETPTTSFQTPQPPSGKFYLGVGYKKDAAGFWKVKHWGNENFAKLTQLLLERRPGYKVIMTGDQGDLIHSIGPISRMVSDRRLEFQMTNLQQSIDILSTCCAYVGNDTGMMHVAASFAMPTLGLFFMGEKSVVKSAPRWGFSSLSQQSFLGDKVDVTPERVLAKLEEMGVV